MSSFFGLVSTRTAIFAVLLGISFTTGYFTAKTLSDIKVARLEQQWTDQQLAAERDYQKQLARAQEIRDRWQQRANALDAQLIAQAQAAQRTETKLRQEIRNAVAQDKADDNCRAGIGAHSVQLYRAALGYKDGESTGHAADTGTAARATHQTATTDKR